MFFLYIYFKNTTAALIELQQSNLHLDISAHLVSTIVSQDSPVLRVLFHAGADPGGHLQRQKICVLLHVSSNNHVPIKGRCMPEGEDGVCVAEVNLSKRLNILVLCHLLIINLFFLGCDTIQLVSFYITNAK